MMQMIVEQFRGRKIIVIGEMMLDEYLSGTSNRICREAPVPVVNIQACDDVPGGAANAAVNLAVMGAQTQFLTVTGHDREAQMVTNALRRVGVETWGIFYDSARQTITKKRVLSDGQLLVRYDYGTTTSLSAEFEQRLIDCLQSLYFAADGVLISDYGYGLITDGVIAALKALQGQERKLLVVDSKHLDRYHDLHPDAVKPNYGEAIALLGLEKERHGARIEQIIANGQRMLDMTGAAMAAITVDSEGAVIFEQGKTPYRTYTRPVADSKAVGAGDTYVSALTMALATGAQRLDAAEIAAAAAMVVVRKEGTAKCSAEELIRFFTLPEKIIANRSELIERVRAYREQGRRIVFTNGCFDILHRGHITYLTQAKTLGDVLIVGVNSDDSIRRLKGTERPINALEDRMHVLAALDCVDFVVSFHEDTSSGLIRIVKPDVYVKGGDYTRSSIAEAQLVESLGGKVEVMPYVVDQSTSAVIEKIKAIG